MHLTREAGQANKTREASQVNKSTQDAIAPNKLIKQDNYGIFSR